MTIRDDLRSPKAEGLAEGAEGFENENPSATNPLIPSDFSLQTEGLNDFCGKECTYVIPAWTSAQARVGHSFTSSVLHGGQSLLVVEGALRAVWPKNNTKQQSSFFFCQSL